MTKLVITYNIRVIVVQFLLFCRVTRPQTPEIETKCIALWTA